MTRVAANISALAPFLLAACSPPAPGEVPGDAADTAPFAEIAADEVIRLTGTEPFWGGQIAGDQLTWTTPDNPQGQGATLTRFAGRGGLSFSGRVGDRSFDLMVTPGTCSDGMSERTYPLVVTVQWGAEQLEGCGWTDRQPFTGGRPFTGGE